MTERGGAALPNRFISGFGSGSCVILCRDFHYSARDGHGFYFAVNIHDFN
jgi:hypothetical protein